MAEFDFDTSGTPRRQRQSESSVWMLAIIAALLAMQIALQLYDQRARQHTEENRIQFELQRDYRARLREADRDRQQREAELIKLGVFDHSKKP